MSLLPLLLLLFYYIRISRHCNNSVDGCRVPVNRSKKEQKYLAFHEHSPKLA